MAMILGTICFFSSIPIYYTFNKILIICCIWLWLFFGGALIPNLVYLSFSDLNIK